jgi:hypothetical protein
VAHGSCPEELTQSVPRDERYCSSPNPKSWSFDAIRGGATFSLRSGDTRGTPRKILTVSHRTLPLPTPPTRPVSALSGEVARLPWVSAWLFLPSSRTRPSIARARNSGWRLGAASQGTPHRHRKPQRHSCGHGAFNHLLTRPTHPFLPLRKAG